jgi:hypothetical protein
MSKKCEDLRSQMAKERQRLDALLFILKGSAEALKRECDPRSIYGRCNLEREASEKKKRPPDGAELSREEAIDLDAKQPAPTSL